MQTKDKSVLYDILAGIITAVISFFILEELKLNMALIAIFPLPLIAGFIRGKTSPENRLLKVILMNLLFLLLIMAIMNGVFHLILILAVALIGTSLGIFVRLNFSTKPVKALGFLSLYSLSVLFLGFFALPAWLDSSMWEKVNREAPNFTLLNLDGDTISSSEYTDKVIILDFWATWCVPCKKQFPLLENIYTEYKENNNVAFFIVNPQIGGDTFEKSLKFIHQSGYDLPFVYDIQSLTYKDLKVAALPCLIIIDKKGVVRYTHTGFNESENFDEILRKHLDTMLNEVD